MRRALRGEEVDQATAMAVVRHRLVGAGFVPAALTMEEALRHYVIEEETRAHERRLLAGAVGEHVLEGLMRVLSRG